MSRPVLRSEQTYSRRSSARTVAPPPPPPPPPRRRTGLIVGIIIAVIVVLVVIGVVVWLLFFRNTSSGGGGGGGGTTNPDQKACRDSSECDSFFTCIDNLCQGFSGASCTKDRNCAEAFACTSGECQPRDCTQDSDCNVNGVTGLVCQNSVCVGGPSTTCENNAQCSSPFVCRLFSNKCGGDIGSDCDTDQDCVVPFQCAGGTCQVQTCANTVECNVGASCYSGKCSVTAANECALDDQCQGGAVCTGEFVGTLGFRSCALYANPVCTINEECLSGTCNNIFGNHHCTCNSDADCEPGTGTTCHNPGVIGTCS